MTPFCFEHEAFWSPKSCKCNYFKEIVKLGRVGTDSTHRGAEKREDVRERDGQSRPGLLLPFGTSGCWPTSGMVATILSDGEKKVGKSKGRVSSKEKLLPSNVQVSSLV